MSNRVKSEAEQASYELLAMYLKVFRISFDISQKEFSDMLNVSRTALSEFESKAKVSDKLLYRLSDAMRKIKSDYDFENPIQSCVVDSIQSEIEKIHRPIIISNIGKFIQKG